MQSLPSHNKKKSFERYRPLNFNGIQGFPNHVSINVRDHLPSFNGKGLESAHQHLERFFDLIGYFEISQEDVCMKIFVQSL